MLLERIVQWLLICEFILIVIGISNNENLIDEEYHRAADKPKGFQQADADDLKRDLWYFGHNPKYYHSNYGGGYGPVGPDNLVYHKEHEPYVSYGYNGETPKYGYKPSYGLFHPSSYGYPTGSESIHPYIHGEGGVIPYGHVGGHPYIGYEQDNGFGLNGIGHYLKKKLTFKKLFLPLAGLALIAAAGVLSKANPVILQLDTNNVGSRIKRSIVQDRRFGESCVTLDRIISIQQGAVGSHFIETNLCRELDLGKSCEIFCDSRPADSDNYVSSMVVFNRSKK